MKHVIQTTLFMAVFLLGLALVIGSLIWTLSLPEKLRDENLWMGLISLELFFSWLTGSFLFLFSSCVVGASLVGLVLQFKGAEWFKALKAKDLTRLEPVNESSRFLWLLYAALLVQQSIVGGLVFWFIPSGYRFTTLCCACSTVAIMAIGLFIQFRNRWMLSRVRIQLHETVSVAEAVSGEIIVVGKEMDGYQNLDFHFRCFETPTLNDRPQDSASFDTSKKDSIDYWSKSAIAESLVYDQTRKENSYPFRIELPYGLPTPGASGVRKSYPFVNWEISLAIPQLFGAKKFRFLLPSIASSEVPTSARLETNVDFKAALASQGIQMTVLNEFNRVRFERSQLSYFSYLFVVAICSLIVGVTLWFDTDIAIRLLSIALLLAGVILPALNSTVEVSQKEVVRRWRLGIIPMQWRYKLSDNAYVVVKRRSFPGEDLAVTKFEVRIENAGEGHWAVPVITLPTHWLGDAVAGSIARSTNLREGPSDDSP